MALAGIEDYIAITGCVRDASRVSRLLDLAESAVLAGAHGQQIVRGTTTNLVVEPYDGFIWLPQRPVVEVLSLIIAGELVDPSTYQVMPGGDRRPAVIIPVAGHRFTAAATVSYTHGWDPVPGQIIAAVVAMASGVIANAGGQPVRQEGAGPFQISLDAGQAPDMSLSPSTRQVLDRLCGVDGAASVPVYRDRL